ncbi:MAG: hypothetical protein ACWGOV_12300 [Acidiferrobacterales bacterium]
MNRKSIITFTFLALASFASVSAQAGIYGDDMAKCLVRSTTTQDRSVLVKWIFAAAASNPEVKSMVSVSEHQRNRLNKSIAKLFERLLTDSCRKETQAAYKYEGKATISSSFNLLGQVAGRELFSDPNVTKSVSGLAQYIDKEKMNDLFASVKK